MKKLLKLTLTMTILLGSLNAFTAPGDFRNLEKGTIKVTKDFTVKGHDGLVEFDHGYVRNQPSIIGTYKFTTCWIVLKQWFYEDKTFLANDKLYTILDVVETDEDSAFFYLSDTKYISHIECKRITNSMSVESIRHAFGDYLEINYPEQDFLGTL